MIILKFTTRYSIDYNLTNTHQFNNKTHGDGVSDNGYAYQSNRRSFYLGIFKPVKMG